jgi:transcription-repair coupling factor (superfamily II helicase)
MITLFLKRICDALHKEKSYAELLKAILPPSFRLEIDGPKGLYLAVVIADLSKRLNKPVLVLGSSDQELEAIRQDLVHTGIDVRTFPAWETLPFQGNLVPQSVHGQRTAAFRAVAKGGACVILASLRAFLMPLGDHTFIKTYYRSLKTGETIDPVKLERFLTESGYLKVPAVTVQGEFALRGEVLDFFPAGDQYPVRIVFEYDRIEEIRTFEPETQMSVEKRSEILLYPAREIIWTEERIQSLHSNLEAAGVAERDRIRETLEDLRTIPGEEYLFPLSFDSPSSLRDYFPENSVLFTIAGERLVHGSDTLKKETSELYTQARRAGRWALPPSAVMNPLEELLRTWSRHVDFPLFSDTDKGKKRCSFPCNGPRSFFGNVTYLKEELANLAQAGYSVTIFAESQSQSQRISHLLKDVPVEVVPVSISMGFSIPRYGIAAIQENEIFGRKRRLPVSVRKASSKPIDTFIELNPGDLVVHVNYGIGRFKGIERTRAAGTERDYIQLEYADEETIFIPIEQVNLIQRYIGGENQTPRLDKIGGASWEKRKNRVRKTVEDLADMLISLYSRRKQARGFAFPKDTDWQVEFEAAFPYEETEDQLTCINEVKADMESEKPMDRLICGDVGYGKTEVGMRAAFKAVMGGKQVAFLAPTTILVEQHFENFRERFERFPVRIEMISRFVSGAEQKRILERLRTGDLDILIGTHRLLQKDVVFKNLGLLIIDEEQRFGVKDKERLKDMKTSIDCLALSATPIPRTLHMSLLKIRDMSLLTTAPYNRQPIETHIAEFKEETVVAAIRGEIERGGQIFYLHNRIETLNDTKAFLARILPEVIVEMAHGQMDSGELEDKMHRFTHGAFQVLLATTIIENGIDIPNVNTIIIDRADMYGISQLYQLRGRVGRSGRKAYAYLLYPEKRNLSEVAMKRLSIISDFTELGSGFKIAMKDMEVRGAGNLLGREQHGEIASVGFDMYLRLLDEAVAEASGSEKKELPEVYLELEYSGYLPDSYISSAEDKMEIYKKIASIQDEADLERVTMELFDKYGPMPEEVHSLLSLAEIRILCGKLRIGSLRERKGVAEIEFTRVAGISVEKVIRLIRESGGGVSIDPYRPEVIRLKTQGIGLAEKSEFMREKLSMLL